MARQRELLAGHEAGISDRDLRVEYPGRSPEARERYGVAASEYAVILVGRDGGEKLRRASPISAEELFATIDEMPMRRRELRDREMRDREMRDSG